MANKDYADDMEKVGRGNARVGGGINPMHLTNDKHPFGVRGGSDEKNQNGSTGRPKFAHSEACGATARDRPGMRSANAAMKTKKV